MRKYIIAIFTKLGRDMTICELCGEKLTILNFHHTKYDGATVYDLKVVCTKCNLLPENKFLE